MRLNSGDRVLFFGDSITEQHLWTLYLENLLLWHEPGLAIRNRGWAANRAVDGLARFDRDAAPLAPTWVFVAFGVNDGRYLPPTGAIADEYGAALSRLVSRVRSIGAEPVLCSPSAVDEGCDPMLKGYNETLVLLTQRCQTVAQREGARFVDLFRPLLAAGPGLAPDGIHPNPQGHLIMARAAAKQLGLTGRGPLLNDGTPDPLLPWRSSAPLPAGLHSVFVDGERAGNYDASDLTRGVTLRGGALRARARAVMALSQSIWQADRAAWRTYGPLGLDGSRSPAAAAALQAVVTRLEESRRQLLQQPFRVEPQPEVPIRLGPWAVSGPYFPDSPELLLSQPFAPEEDPGSASDWRTVAPAGPEGYVDLVPLLGPVNQAVAYARCSFAAPADGELLLRLGSDDGYRLFLNGAPAADVPLFRGSAPGQEVHRLPVRRGLNHLLLRIHQGVGGWDFYATAYLRPNGG